MTDSPHTGWAPEETISAHAALDASNERVQRPEGFTHQYRMKLLQTKGVYLSTPTPTPTRHVGQSTVHLDHGVAVACWDLRGKWLLGRRSCW